MPDKIIAIDIGNTSVNTGIFLSLRNYKSNKIISEGDLSWKNSLLYKIKFETKRTLEQDIKNFLEKYKLSKFNIADVIIASVVPDLNIYFRQIFKKLLGKNVIFANTKNMDLKIKYKCPEKLGIDRALNVLAVKKLLGKSSIIIDIGTAITFDCLDYKLSYIGGIIIPGPEIWFKSLHQYTAKLPLLDISKIKDKTNLIGKSTEECISAGLKYGYSGIINYLTEKLLRETKIKNAKVVITGGFAETFRKYINRMDFLLPDLTLYGLKIYWEHQRSQKLKVKS